MRIIKIEAYPNGAHANQTTSAEITVPEGWAVIPDEMVCENFPFGTITVADGIVTSWTPGTVPEPEPEPVDPTSNEQLRADIDYIAVMSGIDL